MSDASRGDEETATPDSPEPEASTAAGPAADEDGETPAADDEEWVPFEGLSDEGMLLLFAGLACALAALTAASEGYPRPAVAFGGAAGAAAVVVFVADGLTGYVPPTPVLLLVGGGAAVAAGFAATGRHWFNAATFGAAAALLLYRVVDVEYRGAG